MDKKQLQQLLDDGKMGERELLQAVLAAFAEAIDEVMAGYKAEGYDDFPHLRLNDAAQRLYLYTLPTVGETKQ